MMDHFLFSDFAAIISLMRSSHFQIQPSTDQTDTRCRSSIHYPCHTMTFAILELNPMDHRHISFVDPPTASLKSLPSGQISGKTIHTTINIIIVASHCLREFRLEFHETPLSSNPDDFMDIDLFGVAMPYVADIAANLPYTRPIFFEQRPSVAAISFQERSNLFTFVNSFDLLTWTLLAMTLFITALSSMILTLMTIQNAQGCTDRSFLYLGLRKFLKELEGLTTSLFNDGILRQGSAIWAAWLPFAFMIQVLYLAELLRCMMVPTPLNRIEKFADIAEKSPFNEWDVYVIDKSFEEAYIFMADDIVTRSIRPRLRQFTLDIVNSVQYRQECFSKINEGGAIFLQSKGLLEASALLKLITNVWITRGDSTIPYAIPFNPFTAKSLLFKFNQLIIRTREAGLFDQWAHETLRAVDRFIADQYSRKISEYQKLGPRSFIGIAIVTSFGLLLGIIAAYLEKRSNKIHLFTRK